MTENTTTESTESNNNSDSVNAPHAFVLQPGGRVNFADAPAFGHGPNSTAYRLIEDGEAAARLRETTRAGEPAFRYIRADRLADALDTADDAIAAIKAGESDDNLDLLLFAERNEFGNRVTVIDAIADRKREVEQQRQAAGKESQYGLSLDEVAPESTG